MTEAARSKDIDASAFWLALKRIPDIRPAALARLYRRAGPMEAIRSRPEEAAGMLGLESARLGALERDAAATRARLEEFALAGIRALPIESPDYPQALLDLRVPPVVIFVRGEIAPKDARAIAVVGTRTPSQKGLRAAERVAQMAARKGFCVVSGLARGIDTAAHRGALRAGGRSVAIVGNGLLSCYPPENDRLARRIGRQGALLSEVWPEATVSRGALLARDRLQAAMSLAVVVVQTHIGCGSLTTARHAKSCRRPLYALNWEEEPFTIGLARLREVGARVVGQDDLEEVFQAAEARSPELFAAD